MSSEAEFPTTAQLVDKIPLIKSPSFWISKPVELPQDVHPLPESVEAYFVYPHTLESHVLSQLPPALGALTSAHQARLAKLRAYKEAKERARREALNKVAPGWTGGSILEATAAAPKSSLRGSLTAGNPSAHELQENRGQPGGAGGDDMSDFVNGLEMLDSSLGAKADR